MFWLADGSILRGFANVGGATFCACAVLYHIRWMIDFDFEERVNFSCSPNNLEVVTTFGVNVRC